MEFSGSKSLRTEPCRYYWGRAGQSVLELEGWAFFDMPAAIGRQQRPTYGWRTRKSVVCSFMRPRVPRLDLCSAKSTTLTWSSTVAEATRPVPG